jgi:hypothetical protein
MGTLGILSRYGKAWPPWSDKAVQRRLAEIRDIGLLLVDRPPIVDPELELGVLCDLWRVRAAA